jgi:hypothetical protein
MEQLAAHLNKLEDKDITCCFTLQACARLSVDAVCCVPCCCFCGGCCGRYNPIVIGLFPNNVAQHVNPGWDRFGLTCITQLIAASVLPSTFCGCCWAGCGLCTPCTRKVIEKVSQVEKNNTKTTVEEPTSPPIVLTIE